MKKILCLMLGVVTLLSICGIGSAADGTHGFYSNCDLSVVNNKADGFFLDFYSDSENALCTYWSNANWSMYTRSKRTLEKYKSLSGGGAYAGLQIADTPSDRRAVMSMWSWEYNVGKKKEYLNADVMTGTFARNGNEGYGTSCVMKYNWKSGTWYRQMLYCWTDLETEETMIGSWYYDYDADHWDLFVYYNTHLYDSYISGGVGQFLENFSEYCRENVRSYRYRNIYFLSHETGEWVGSPTFSIHSDGNPKAMGEAHLGVSDDQTYVWASVDGTSTTDTDEMESLTVTLKQAEKPENIGTPEIGNIKVDRRKSLTEEGAINSIIRWDMAEHSTPQLIYEIHVEDLEGNSLYQNKQSRPHVQDLSVGNLGTEAYKITLSFPDPFGQSTEKTYESAAYTEAKNASGEETTSETSEGGNTGTSVILSPAVIIGIACGVVAIAAVIVVVIVIIKKKKNH